MAKREVAPEVCRHCDRSVWADEEQELYLDSRGEADCSAAPLVENPAGAQYPMITDVHDV